MTLKERISEDMKTAMRARDAARLGAIRLLLAAVKQKLSPKGDKLQVLFVSVDPARDTADMLKSYMANFDPSFLALRGSDAELAQMAKDFKIYYKKVDGQTPATYTMDHTAGDYLFDPEGRWRRQQRHAVPAHHGDCCHRSEAGNHLPAEDGMIGRLLPRCTVDHRGHHRHFHFTDARLVDRSHGLQRRFHGDLAA